MYTYNSHKIDIAGYTDLENLNPLLDPIIENAYKTAVYLSKTLSEYNNIKIEERNNLLFNRALANKDLNMLNYLLQTSDIVVNFGETDPNQSVLLIVFDIMQLAKTTEHVDKNERIDHAERTFKFLLAKAEKEGSLHTVNSILRQYRQFNKIGDFLADETQIKLFIIDIKIALDDEECNWSTQGRGFFKYKPPAHIEQLNIFLKGFNETSCPDPSEHTITIIKTLMEAVESPSLLRKAATQKFYDQWLAKGLKLLNTSYNEFKIKYPLPQDLPGNVYVGKYGR
jgi:hypothetical protein